MPRKRAPVKGPRYVYVPFLTGKAKVSSKGWIVIPKEIRDEMGIKPGDELAFSLHGPLPTMKQDKRLSEIHVIKLPKSRTELVDLFWGIVPPRPGEPLSADALLDEHRREVGEDERRVREARRRRRPKSA
jgi:AbrB family looped-hinge helix DNA binding protein